MNTLPSQTNTHLPANIRRSRRAALFTAVCTLLVAFVNSAPAANILSQWNFDDVANPSSTVGNIGGYTGTFFGATVSRSANSFGVSGTPGDYALSLGGAGVLGARVD